MLSLNPILLNPSKSMDQFWVKLVKLHDEIGRYILEVPNMYTEAVDWGSPTEKSENDVKN